MIYLALQIALLLLTPWLTLRLQGRLKGGSWLNPVILCYATGILFAQWPFGLYFEATATWTRDIFLLLGIPLLLYGTDLRAFRRQARPTTISFFLCISLAFGCAVATALWFFPAMPENWQLAGMLTGLYSGGIPNLNAVGRGLGASEALLIYGNTSDIIVGGLFLLFLTSAARPFYAWVLGDKSRPEIQVQVEMAPEVAQQIEAGLWHPDNIKGLGLSLIIAGLAAGGTLLLTGALEAISLLLLLLTSLSILAGFSKQVQAWKGSFALGEYFLLIFCTALGMLADFGNIVAEGGQVIRFMAIVLGSTVLLHLLISRFFRIDADTSILMVTAALYGPVFIPQVATAIGNRGLIFAGIAMGLVGYAIGNYLGLGAGYVVRMMN